jgi:hypothetical protein
MAALPRGSLNPTTAAGFLYLTLVGLAFALYVWTDSSDPWQRSARSILRVDLGGRPIKDAAAAIDGALRASVPDARAVVPREGLEAAWRTEDGKLEAELMPPTETKVLPTLGELKGKLSFDGGKVSGYPDPTRYSVPATLRLTSVRSPEVVALVKGAIAAALYADADSRRNPPWEAVRRAGFEAARSPDPPVPLLVRARDFITNTLLTITSSVFLAFAAYLTHIAILGPPDANAQPPSITAATCFVAIWGGGAYLGVLLLRSRRPPLREWPHETDPLWSDGRGP